MNAGSHSHIDSMDPVSDPRGVPEVRDYNTLKEAAAIWRITDREVRNLRKEGELPEPVSRGSRKFYTREQMEWVKRRDHIRAGFLSG